MKCQKALEMKVLSSPVTSAAVIWEMKTGMKTRLVEPDITFS